jgi:hypothetical protein
MADDIRRSDDPLRPQEGLSTAAIAGAGERPTAAPSGTSDGSARGSASSVPQQGLDNAAPLFPPHEVDQLRERWTDVQAGFVDEPRAAVERADGLVAAAMKRLAETFAEERTRLEGQWDRGDNVSTEDLRVALQRYRSFFTRLLSL